VPLTLILSRMRREGKRDKRENLFYIGRGGFYRGVGEDEECDRVIVSLGSWKSDKRKIVKKLREGL
jgi:prefoldin subunit 5